MRVAVFGGSFDPVHEEHKNLVRAAIAALALDHVIVMPSYRAPHKGEGAAGSSDRYDLCRIAFRDVKEVEIGSFELQNGATSYTYLTCRWFQERYPSDDRFFLVGEDMLEDFFTWRNPQDILSRVTLAVCGRNGEIPRAVRTRFESTFGCSFIAVPYIGKAVSSTRLRTALAFGKEPNELDGEVYREIKRRKLYEYEPILPALTLEKPERREHSFRVAEMACGRARSAGVSEYKALIASALHDCGKYVPSDSPLLKGFTSPEAVPPPVLHQYTGAYLAEHAFGITDPEIVDAIRYHTSARENMTALGKLVYLADLLEAGRVFEGVEELRGLFRRDLDACFLESLRRQVVYLKETGKPVYALTERAYEYEKKNQK